MSDNSREKVRAFVFIAAGIYLVYLAGKLIRDLPEQDNQSWYMYLPAVLFIVAAIVLIIVAVRMLKKPQEDDGQEKENEAAAQTSAAQEGKDDAACGIDDKEALPAGAPAKERDIKAVILISRDVWKDETVLPDCLEERDDAPAAYFVKQALCDAGAKKVRYVLGHKNEKVRVALADRGVSFTVQDGNEGSGNALLCVLDFIGTNADVFVIGGGVTDISSDTLKNMLDWHREEQNAVTSLGRLSGDGGFVYIFRAEQLCAAYKEEQIPGNGLLTAEDAAGKVSEISGRSGVYDPQG